MAEQTIADGKNYVDKDFMYLADAYIDDDAFNSFFGSSVLEMVCPACLKRLLPKPKG